MKKFFTLILIAVMFTTFCFIGCTKDVPKVETTATPEVTEVPETTEEPNEDSQSGEIVEDEGEIPFEENSETPAEN